MAYIKKLSAFVMLLLCSNLAWSKELIIALNNEFETLNPIVNSMMAAIYVQDAVLRPVIALDPNAKPYAVLLTKIPNLKDKSARLVQAKKSKSNNKSKNNLHVDLEFKEQASWGDGVPVTCKDLKLAWEIGRHENTATPNKEDYQNIDEIRINTSNAKRCTVIFQEPRWNFYLNFPRPIPEHLERQVFEKFRSQPQGYERNSNYIKELTLKGLYNGPFRVTELKLGSHLVLQINENYIGQRPKIEKLIFKFILNTATLEPNLRSGNINMTSSSGFSIDQAFAFEKKIEQDKLPFKVRIVPGMIYSHIDFNLNHQILSDLKVRQAMAYGLDREEMVKAFFQGRQKPAHHFASDLDSWFTNNPKLVKIYDIDRKKANQLLDDAGWKLAKDGFRYKNAKKLSLHLTGASDNKLIEVMQVFIQDQFKKLGIEILIKNYPARVLFSEILKKRDFELGIYAFVFNPDGMQRTTLHSESIPSATNSWSGSNRPGWRNKEVDQWLEQVDSEFDSNRRNKLMQKVMKAYTQELPALPLYYRSSNSVIPAGLKNFQLSGHVFTEYLQIENWEIQ